MSQPTNMEKIYKELQEENVELKEENASLEKTIQEFVAVCNTNKEIHKKINFLEKKHRKELEELRPKYEKLMKKYIKIKDELQEIKEKKLKRKRKRLKKLQDAKCEGGTKRLKSFR